MYFTIVNRFLVFFLGRFIRFSLVLFGVLYRFQEFCDGIQWEKLVLSENGVLSKVYFHKIRRKIFFKRIYSLSK